MIYLTESESNAISNVRHCNACNNVVSFTKRLTNATDGMHLRKSVAKWCENSGNNANAGVCLSIAADLISFFARFKFDTFCTVVNACKSGDVLLPESLQQPFIGDDVTCDFCVNTLTHIKGIVASKETENEFKLLLSQICTYLGSFRNECVTMLDQNLDDIFDFLNKELNPQSLCQQAGLCPKKVDDTQKNNALPAIEEVINIYPVNNFDTPKKVDWRDASIKAIAKPLTATDKLHAAFGPECFVCKKIFDYVYEYISKSENKTDEVIIEALDKVCVEVFTAHIDKCERIINESVHDIIYYLKIAVKPELACTLLGYCVGVTELEMKPVEQTFTPNCVLCKEVLTWVYNELKDNKTEDAILNALDRVCERIMPKAKVQECKDWVNQYTEQLINIITQTTNPAEACELLGFCNARKVWIPFVKVQKTAWKMVDGKAVSTFTKIEKTATKVGTSVKGALCDICRQVFTWLNNEVSNPRIKDEVISALDKVCDAAFPASQRDECKGFVENHVNEIVEIIVNDTEPDVACATLRVCKYNKDDNRIEVVEKPSNGIGKKRPSFTMREDFCYVCQLAAHFIQEELYNYKNEEAINHFIETQLCDRLVNVVERDTCNDYIKEYGATIEQLIAQKIFDPTVMCEKMLRICPHANKSNPRLEFEMLKESKEKVCHICMKAVDRLDDIRHTIDYQPLDKNISVMAVTACKVLPSEEIVQCQNILETFGLSFLQTNKDLLDSRRICSSVDLCLAPGKVHLLGGHKCTFGPSYWCHTSAHADACKATDYCKQKVWKAIP